MHCRRFGILRPAEFLRLIRDIVRRKRCSERLPPTAHLFGFSSTQFATLNACVFLFQTAVVFGSNARLFGGRTNKEISEQHKSLATPAGWAFAIWGIIYTGELVAVVYMCTAPSSDVVAAASPAWLVGNALQAAWAIAFAREQISLAAVLLTGIAIAMVQCERALVGGEPLEQLAALATWPIGLHAGWVCAAAVVSWNVAAVARKAPFSVQISLAFASLYVALALALALLGTSLGANFPPTATLAISWALYAIGQEVKRSGDARVIEPLRQALYHTSTAAAALVAVSTAFALLANGASNQGPGVATTGLASEVCPARV